MAEQINPEDRVAIQPKPRARAYLTRDADQSHIARTLHSAATGYTVLDRRIQATVLAAAAPASTTAPASDDGSDPGRTELPDGLTAHEGEILALLARGLSNAEIAAYLFLSSNTVKTHINRIFTKTGSRDRVAATHYAQRHHLD